MTQGQILQEAWKVDGVPPSSVCVATCAHELVANPFKGASWLFIRSAPLKPNAFNFQTETSLLADFTKT